MGDDESDDEGDKEGVGDEEDDGGDDAGEAKDDWYTVEAAALEMISVMRRMRMRVVVMRRVRPKMLGIPWRQRRG